ncbi:hypothetical protein PRZ48_011744 [Zasmidium cellare]|uniref:O-methyltransferase C-terminal domain-containing protein n=1 Tax=Zasmidium cellare TaxID=395010 RepID=A0ABR0E7J6_ZASCE|nr:hypothetical protein PRZ48_011744 [Zasmidium cellare]
MATASHLIELANTIQTQVTEFQKLLAASGQPDPSLDLDAPSPDFAAAGLHAQDVRSKLLDQIDELHDLLLTPQEMLLGTAPTDFVSRHALDRFQVYQKVPVGETRTYTQLAEATGLPLNVIRRLIRHAITQRIFTEPTPDVVAHTPASKLLAEDRNVRDYWGILSEIVSPAAAQTANALSKWPQESGSKKRETAGFYLATGKTVYQVLEDEPETHNRYDSAMSANRNNVLFSVDHIARGFDWQSLGKGTIVDVAGGIGTVSRSLAKHFPELNFIVQDQPEVLAQAPPVEDESSKARITFMEHDMFTPQPIKDADIYFFRRVFMEWDDDKAVQILRNLTPGMTPGKSRVVIADFYVPEPGEAPLWIERKFRNSDMLTFVLSNGGSRDKEAWIKLFEKAGPGFVVKNVKPLKNSDMMITEALWQGE